PGRPGVDLADPDRRPAAVEAQHDEVLGIGRVDAPLLVRRENVELYLGIAVGQLAEHLLDGPGIDRRSPGSEALAKGPHPLMIHVELLPSGERPPRDELVDVRIAGVVADVLALEPRPRRRRDDLARLGDNGAEADLLLFLAFSQMNVIAPGRLGKFRPRLYRNLAVGFRGQHEYSLAGIDIGLDPGPACRRSVGDHAVELCKQFDLMPGVP